MEKEKKSPDSDKRKTQGNGNRALRLMGIAAQMGGTIFLGAWLGRYLDEKYPSNKNWWTMGLTIFAVCISLYSVVQQLNKLNDEEKKQKKDD